MTMARYVLPIIVGLLLAVATGLAIYAAASSAKLWLPLSPALTISTIFVPILGFFNTFIPPGLTGSSAPNAPKLNSRSLVTSSNSGRPGSFVRSAAPGFLNLFQALVTTALATWTLTRGTPGPIQDCALETTWKRFWTSHNAQAITTVQDALSCCGFNTVKDRAWPFPGVPGPVCKDRYGRDLACAGPWRAILQRNARIITGVLVAVGVIQFLVHAFSQYQARYGQRTWSQSWESPAHRGHEQQRPLLQGPDSPTDEEHRIGYGTRDEDGPRMLPAAATAETQNGNGNHRSEGAGPWAE